MTSILILILVCSTYLTAQDSKVNIAVLDLDPTNISAQNAQFLSDRLRTELFETGKFRVLERDKMRNILEEQGFQFSGCTTIECAVEAGQLLNVQQMVAGNIGQIEELYSISLRLIDVKTGAIIKTATRDYRGKLSSVLTDVIPAVANQLAETAIPLNKDPVMRVKQEGKTPDAVRVPKFSIHLRGGVAGLNFRNDLNDAVQNFNNTTTAAFSVDEADSLAALNHFELEIQYLLRPQLNLKFGIGVQTMLSAWAYNESNYTNQDAEFKYLSLQRRFSFLNLYLGMNYKFWYNPRHFASYIGVDLGLLSLTSKFIEEYRLTDDFEFNSEESNNFGGLALKLALGFDYYLGKHLLIGLEIAGQLSSAFDTSGEKSAFAQYPVEFADIMFPNEVNASGILVNLSLGYRF
jgi:hypothetical protein